MQFSSAWKKRWSAGIRPVFFVSAGVFTISVTCLAQPPQTKSPDSNAKVIAELQYPDYPKELLQRIEGSRKVKNQPQGDSLLSHEWGLASIGFLDIFSPLAQSSKPSTNCSSKEIIVAVVDTGIDYTHPDLRDHLWVNHGESGYWEPKEFDKGYASNCRDKSCNGLDDDKNGYVDDVVGWDFVHEVPLPFDTHGHGTHIAGIIASSAGVGASAPGVCHNVSLMALKYYDNGGSGYNNLANTVRAVEYAVANGAQIINYSGGGADPAASERLAVTEAQRKGVLFIAAAGNDGRSNDRRPYYPASYPLDNIISVASINRFERLLPSSNFGKAVHVAAPGLMILSTLPGGKYGNMSGTSQATAFVTGAAALLASQTASVGFDYKLVKNSILEGARPMRLNGSKSLLAAGLLSLPGSLQAQRAAIAKVPPAVAKAAEVAAAALGATGTKTR